MHLAFQSPSAQVTAEIQQGRDRSVFPYTGGLVTNTSATPHVNTAALDAFNSVLQPSGSNISSLIEVCRACATINALTGTMILSRVCIALVALVCDQSKLCAQHVHAFCRSSPKEVSEGNPDVSYAQAISMEARLQHCVAHGQQMHSPVPSSG